jgi:hypothetical protein
MPEPRDIDGVLVQWGDRLFYPGNRMVKPTPQPRLSGFGSGRAALIRERIAATVVRRAPQVMVKVTGGGRGMKAIAAHFRYISKNGRLEIEDERGQPGLGRDAVRELVEDWRLGGSLIEDVSDRREAFNIMLSMPRGVDALTVQRAAREFAKTELADHKYVMVLHDHQANPHVHLSVRAESMHGKRLNPRKADLQRWRETFAERLRGWGIDAEATRQATRGEVRNYEPLWRTGARKEDRLILPSREIKSGAAAANSRTNALVAWIKIAQALDASDRPEDRRLASEVVRYIKQTPVGVERMKRLERERQRNLPGMSRPSPSPAPPGPSPPSPAPRS